MLKRKYENHPIWFQYIEEILSKLPFEFIENSTSLNKVDGGEKLKDLGPVTMQKLIDLNRKAKKLSAEFHRAQTKWDNLSLKTFMIEDILENKFSIEKRIRSTLWISREG